LYIVYLCYIVVLLRCCDIKGFKETSVSYSSAHPSYVSNLSKQTLDRNIKYVQGEKPACLLVNKPQFRKLECISEGDTYYEVELAKDKIKIDLPHSTGLHNSTVRKT